MSQEPDEVKSNDNNKTAVLITLLVIILMPVSGISIANFSQRNIKTEDLGIMNVWDTPEPYKAFKVGQFSRVKDRTTNIYFRALEVASKNSRVRCYTVKMIGSYNEKDPLEKRISYSLLKVSDIGKNECLNPS